MRIEDQICNFEHATKLKELGINIHSLFYYVNNWLNPRKDPVDNGQYIISSEMKHLTKCRGKERNTEVEFVSAFTATELGQLLPFNLISEKFEYGLVLMQSFPDGKEQNYFLCSYVEVYSDLDYGGTVYSCAAKTEANSRAKLLIDLIEEGIINVDSINEEYNKTPETEVF